MRRVAVIAVALLVPLGCSSKAVHTRRPDVILISLDTLRRDQLGIYNPDAKDTTPSLDQFAAQAVVFDDAWSEIGFTLSSHMCMFTGLEPDVHGVLGEKDQLPRGIPTLPQLLAADGYHTLGLVTNLWMKGEFGFARGFDHYERLPFAVSYAERVNQRALDLLDAAAGDPRPVFLFLHYLDCHSDWVQVTGESLPYWAPPSVISSAGLDPETLRFCDDDGNCATDFLLAADRTGRSVPDATIATLRTLYRCGVEYTDHDIGELFRQLRQRRLFENSLVIVTSDHGEEFREHGKFLHGQPYAEDLRVPLLVKLPRAVRAGTHVTGAVELIDLLPTIMELVGAEAPQGIQGRSLTAAIDGRALAPRPILGRDKTRSSIHSLRMGGFALVVDSATGASQLFDLRTDPGERSDVAAQQPDRVASMRKALERLVAADQRRRDGIAAGVESGDGESALSDHEREQLHSIGYVN